MIAWLTNPATPGLIARLRSLADEPGELLTVVFLQPRRSARVAVRVRGPSGRALSRLEAAHVRATLASHAVEPY